MNRYIKTLIAILAIFTMSCLFFTTQIMFPFANKPSKTFDESIENKKYLNASEFVQIEYDDSIFHGAKLSPMSPKNCTVLLIHGFRSSFLYPLKFSSLFLKNGCEVYSYDLPAHGKSEGKILTWGKYEVPYLEHIISTIKSNKGSDHSIGLFGLSLGGALAIQLASRSDFEFVISDSSYSTISDIFTFQGRERYGVMADIFLYPSIWLSEMLYRVDFDALSPKNIITKVEEPVLIVHSNQDDYTPVSHAKELKSVTKEKENIKFLFTNWNAKHVKSFDDNKVEYIRAVDSFLNSR